MSLQNSWDNLLTSKSANEIVLHPMFLPFSNQWSMLLTIFGGKFDFNDFKSQCCLNIIKEHFNWRKLLKIDKNTNGTTHLKITGIRSGEVLWHWAQHSKFGGQKFPAPPDFFSAAFELKVEEQWEMNPLPGEHNV